MAKSENPAHARTANASLEPKDHPSAVFLQIACDLQASIAGMRHETPEAATAQSAATAFPAAEPARRLNPQA